MDTLWLTKRYQGQNFTNKLFTIQTSSNIGQGEVCTPLPLLNTKRNCPLPLQFSSSETNIFPTIYYILLILISSSFIKVCTVGAFNSLPPSLLPCISKVFSLWLNIFNIISREAFVFSFWFYTNEIKFIAWQTWHALILIFQILISIWIGYNIYQ